jgi:hypothetical protein
VIHCLFHVDCWHTIQGLGKKHWKKCVSKNEGRRDFWIDLVTDLMNYGLELDWDGNNKHWCPTYAGGIHLFLVIVKLVFFFANMA